MAKKIVVGLDGGGTKTECVVLDFEAQVVGRAQTGPGNPNSAGDELARFNVIHAINSAVQHANCTNVNIATICVGMAGVDRLAERTRIAQWLTDVLPNTPFHIYNDAVIALASGTHGELHGIVMISGTGMIIYGMNREGHICRAGGWGALLGDKGSGYAIGTAILNAVTEAVDGIGPTTTLQEAVSTYLNLKKPQELIAWAYADTGWHHFAQLAPLAMERAECGDAVASAIIEQAAIDLTNAAHAVIHRLHFVDKPFSMVLSGGNLKPGLLSTLVTQKLGDIAPNAKIIYPTIEPAVGAALLALNNMKCEHA